MKEQVNKIAQKYEDFWAKHNLTTRIGIFLFVFVYIFATLGVFYVHIDPAIAKVLLETTSYTAFLSIAMVVLGSNTIVKVAEVLKGGDVELPKHNSLKEDEDINPPKLY